MGQRQIGCGSPGSVVQARVHATWGARPPPPPPAPPVPCNAATRLPCGLLLLRMPTSATPTSRLFLFQKGSSAEKMRPLSSGMYSTAEICRGRRAAARGGVAVMQGGGRTGTHGPHARTAPRQPPPAHPASPAACLQRPGAALVLQHLEALQAELRHDGEAVLGPRLAALQLEDLWQARGGRRLKGAHAYASAATAASALP